MMHWWRRFARKKRRCALADAVWYGRRVCVYLVMGQDDTYGCHLAALAEQVARLRAEFWETLGGTHGKEI